MSASGLSVGGVTPSRRRGISGLAVSALVVLVSAIVAALAAPALLDAVVSLGRYIESPDVAVDYVKGVLWAIALGISIRFWPVSPAERRVLSALWVVKCAITLGFMLLYEWNYDVLDAWGYFRIAQLPTFDFSQISLGNGTFFVQALSWLHAHWLVSSYHALKVTWSMVGLIGVFVFYRAAGLATGERRLVILVALACFPSILFWSSILGKDPIALLGIALFAYGVTSWLRRGAPTAILAAAAGLCIAVSIRLWLGPILLGPLLLVAVAAVRGWIQRIAVLVVATALLAALIVPLRQYLAIEALSDSLDVVQSKSQSWAEGGSAQTLTTDLSDPIQLLKFLPLGAATALFRPLPGEIMNPFGLLAGTENLLVLTALAVALRRARWSALSDPVMMWAAGFVVLWAIAYGPISYQNLGTAVRFRLQVLPVMLLLLGYLIRTPARVAPPVRRAISP